MVYELVLVGYRMKSRLFVRIAIGFARIGLLGLSLWFASRVLDEGSLIRVTNHLLAGQVGWGYLTALYMPWGVTKCGFIIGHIYIFVWQIYHLWVCMVSKDC